MGETTVPFNRPYATGRELGYIQQAIDASETAAGGPFARRCEAWLARHHGSAAALLTHSGTGALELAALLSGVGPGDEVIMPSFTFTSTANAFVLRGAVPVFVDVREDTLRIDADLVADAVTPRTRAVVPVHYAGAAVDMDPLLELAREHGLMVIEDAAHALPSDLRGRPLGSLGELGALSFHETKNLTCGEGGALLINDERLVSRARMLIDKGTDRGRFLRGEVDRYSWRDVGSSFAASDVSAAFLWAQLEAVDDITASRRDVWDAYHSAFTALEDSGRVRRPVVCSDGEHNAHLYGLQVTGPPGRDGVIDALAARGVQAVFHYVPLHLSQAGRRFGRPHGDLVVSERVSARLLRLPLWAKMPPDAVEHVIRAVYEALGVQAPATTRP
jgi:dTDP-4-amino-4,6-dideoxygalactose transaminase